MDTLDTLANDRQATLAWLAAIGRGDLGAALEALWASEAVMTIRAFPLRRPHTRMRAGDPEGS